MKVLVDECGPLALKETLAARGHDCSTVQEAGWSGKKNGQLLDLAEDRYDVLVTLDTNLQYQQNLVGRKIAILIIKTRSNRLTVLEGYFSACARALETISPGEVVYVGGADDLTKKDGGNP
jgi:predicted nuclease of predicted toxin-antitoxin system